MTPSDVRDRLVEALRLDLIGPGPEDAAYQTLRYDGDPIPPITVATNTSTPAPTE